MHGLSSSLASGRTFPHIATCKMVTFGSPFPASVWLIFFAGLTYSCSHDVLQGNRWEAGRTQKETGGFVGFPGVGWLCETGTVPVFQTCRLEPDRPPSEKASWTGIVE